MRLSELNSGESATVVKVLGHGGFRRRIVELGFARGTKVEVILNAPLKDPIEYRLLGYNISLRRAEAEMVVVVTDAEAARLMEHNSVDTTISEEFINEGINRRKRHINVALVGNPNCGKTSLFNHITGAHEHVGNYSGVTVDAKTGYCHHKGYELHITDLPGTYALSAYTPEELYVRSHLATSMPDVVLNVVCSSNIERNLYLTTELIDMSQRMVVALNMYDELQRSGATLDHDMLGKMLGVPMIPVMGHTGQGVDELLDTVIAVYENSDSRVRHIHINQGVAEESVMVLDADMKAHKEELPKCFPPRYFAMKMLEGDEDICNMLRGSSRYPKWLKICEKKQAHLKYDLGADEDIATTMADQKYGFIAGALRETYTAGRENANNITDRIDAIVTHRIWGYPIFLLLIWALFYCTFHLGAYPQQWIESLVTFVGDCFQRWLPDGILKDMITDGIIGGVGSVIVFLPNIMILYLLISFMEDSGYLARAAFIMDKLMHKAGLHGKAFIPLIMGFGCNVPAVMSTRIIESRSSRLITTFIIPFMSCSARLPVYIVFIGTFFAAHSGTVMTALYLLGIVVAVATARLMRHFMFKVDETPFVMELPPYRIPTLKATMSHMWSRCAQYLRKMGGMILVASLVIWFLGYFPRQSEGESVSQHYERSYIGRIGHLCEPVFEPLGLNWKSGVAVLSGVAAKEIMVSTMGVLYAEEEYMVEPSNKIAAMSENAEGAESTRLHERLVASGDFSNASVLALLVFTLLYLPCIATIAAIRSEAGWRWAVASIIYTTVVAWLCAFAVYRIALLF
ncbi:MAG: ferrous iron transport protein B [Alistipes sp.]|nr:ferrous iron transport protein B [Alistipes sp.]